jgi:hypothetical protein
MCLLKRSMKQLYHGYRDISKPFDFPMGQNQKV